MAWEQIRAAGIGRANFYGPGYTDHPCIGISKTGISVNHLAMAAFDIQPGRFIAVMVDRARRVLGLKQIPAGESAIGAYKANNHQKGKGRRAGVYLNVTAVGKQFPDCIGHAYRAHLNAGERVIEISLSVENIA